MVHLKAFNITGFHPSRVFETPCLPKEVGGALTFEQLRIYAHVGNFYSATISMLCSESLIFETFPT